MLCLLYVSLERVDLQHTRVDSSVGIHVKARHPVFYVLTCGLGVGTAMPIPAFSQCLQHNWGPPRYAPVSMQVRPSGSAGTPQW